MRPNADAGAQGLASRANDQSSTSGIRFRLEASIRAAPLAARRLYADSTASLIAKIRISAHARESQFFGYAFLKATDFSPVEGSARQMVWQDANCHQRRGLPKETVVAIDGAIITPRGKVSVRARERRLGLLLPGDEITQGFRLPDKIDDREPFIAYRSRTRSSHLFVDVRIYTEQCTIGAHG